MSAVDTLKNKSGTTITELILAVGILSVVVAGVTSYMIRAQKTMNVNEIRKVQTNLHQRLLVKASSPVAFAVSHREANTSDPYGQALMACIDPQSECKGATSASDQQPFELYEEVSRDNGGFEREVQVAGTPTSPVFYDTKGAICRGPDASKCPLRAMAFWWATCRNQNDSLGTVYEKCYTPESMHVRIQIVANVSREEQQDRFGGNINSYPFDDQFDADMTSFSASVPYAQVHKVIGSTCASDQRMVGYDSNGRVKCECFVKKFKGSNYDTDAFGRVRCGGQQCTGNLNVWVGFDEDGKIKCQNLGDCVVDDKKGGKKKRQDCPCEEINLSSNGECRPGFWLARIDYGSCTAVTNDKTATTLDIVECEEDRGICCQVAL